MGWCAILNFIGARDDSCSSQIFLLMKTFSKRVFCLVIGYAFAYQEGKTRVNLKLYRTKKTLQLKLLKIDCLF